MHSKLSISSKSCVVVQFGLEELRHVFKEWIIQWPSRGDFTKSNRNQNSPFCSILRKQFTRPSASLAIWPAELKLLKYLGKTSHMGCVALNWLAIEETALSTLAWVKSKTGSSVAYPYLPLMFLKMCRISWAYFATPISLKWRPSFLKSVLDRSWVSMCQFFRCLSCWTIKSFTSTIFSFKAGLSCRGGILDMINILSLLLRDTLSMICRISSLHCPRGWESMLFLPAASTVTSLDGICLIWALICRAVLPGYTYPEASQSLPCTRGATPRTLELPTIVTVTGFGVGLFARGCGCWLVVADVGPVGPSSRAAVTARFVTRFNLWLRHDLWPHNASICDQLRGQRTYSAGWRRDLGHLDQ